MSSAVHGASDRTMPRSERPGAIARHSAQLRDHSHFYRFGLKGPRAAAWLEQHGLKVPARANTWTTFDADDPVAIIARLGNSEFFVECSRPGPLFKQLTDELAAPLDHVYPVLREDRALVVSGAEATAVLAQVCNVDFASGAGGERAVVMTMMMGVAVLVVPHDQSCSAAQRERITEFRIWCDPSFGDYVWSTLHEVIGS